MPKDDESQSQGGPAKIIASAVAAAITIVAGVFASHRLEQTPPSPQVNGPGVARQVPSTTASALPGSVPPAAVEPAAPSSAVARRPITTSAAHFGPHLLSAAGLRTAEGAGGAAGRETSGSAARRRGVTDGVKSTALG